MTESNQSVSAKQVRDVVALGKKTSKTAFPNPMREDCPNSSTLRAMAYRDPRLTLKDLPVSHVVTCSPCFQEYARLRRMSILMRSIQVTAASLAVLAVQDTSSTETAPRQLSFTNWYGTRRLRTSTKGFGWNRSQRGTSHGPIEQWRHFGRGGPRLLYRFPRQL